MSTGFDVLCIKYGEGGLGSPTTLQTNISILLSAAPFNITSMLTASDSNSRNLYIPTPKNDPLVVQGCWEFLGIGHGSQDRCEGYCLELYKACK